MRSLRQIPFAALLFAAAAAAQPTVERNSCSSPSVGSAGSPFALAVADWDGDFDADLAVGRAGWDNPADAGEADHGYFRVLEHSGGADDLLAQTYASLTSIDGAESGRAIVAGDFNHDDRREFAYSLPESGGGAVRVVGVDPGTGTAGQQGILLEQGATGISGASEPGDRFGWALAAGDFDGDGYDDLAVGVPRESWSGVSGVSHGAVHVFFGGAAGLDGARDLLFGQNEFSGQTQEGGDAFGSSLAAGDLDRDGYVDLVIGAPMEDEGAVLDSGVVHVVFGGAAGLDFSRQQTWSQSSAGIGSSPEAADHFGASLAVGAFRTAESSGFGDLAIGVPDEDDGEVADAGVVHVLYGTAAGPTSAGSQLLGRPGGPLDGAHFGHALLAHSLDRDESVDLAVSAPSVPDGDPSFFGAGEVYLFYGLEGGLLRPSGRPAWRSTEGACFEQAYEATRFGETLAAGDFDNDGRQDLAVAISGWTASSLEASQGAIQVLFGDPALFRDGFDTGDVFRWSAAAP
jgi:hypothetical protein